MTEPSIVDHLHTRFGSALRIGADCDLPPDLCVEVDDDAVLILGNRVSIRRGTTIQVHRGATVIIGDDVAIGENTFISAMVGIRIGDGVGISNMVDLHDHNHRDRSTTHVSDGELTPWAGGFAGAPILVETGAVLSNKVSITAGVRIGQNTIIGAGSTVTRSIAPNSVAVGTPATVERTFDAVLNGADERHGIAVAWFGTSIMQHHEAFNAQMHDQADLPDIGSTVTVEAWRTRGYVHRLHTTLQSRWPDLDITFHNYGMGGSTSRDVLQVVRDHTGPQHPPTEVSVLGCGINDVWRGFQGRLTEAVDLPEFVTNYRAILDLLTENSRQVICIAETPFGWDDALDITAANTALQQYNAAAAQLATTAGATFIDVWPTFTTTARRLAPGAVRSGLSLWSDGVHLSELGDALLHDLTRPEVDDAVARMTTYAIHDRDIAVARYRGLFADIRTATPTFTGP